MPNPYNGNEEELPNFLKPMGFSFEVLLNFCFSISSDKVINISDYEIMHPQSHLQSVLCTIVYVVTSSSCKRDRSNKLRLECVHPLSTVLLPVNMDFHSGNAT